MKKWIENFKFIVMVAIMGIGWFGMAVILLLVAYTIWK